MLPMIDAHFYVWSASAINTLGLLSPNDTFLWGFTVDLSPPIYSIVAPPTAVRCTSPVDPLAPLDINVIDGGSGVSTVYVALDGVVYPAVFIGSNIWRFNWP